MFSFAETQKNKAKKSLRWKELPEDGPFRDTIDCLRNELAPSDLNDKISNMPKNFQNDARFIVAVRYFLDGETRKADKMLRRCVTESQPTSDWPAPYARQIHTSLAK